MDDDDPDEPGEGVGDTTPLLEPPGVEPLGIAPLGGFQPDGGFAPDGNFIPEGGPLDGVFV